MLQGVLETKMRTAQSGATSRKKLNPAKTAQQKQTMQKQTVSTNTEPDVQYTACSYKPKQTLKEWEQGEILITPYSRHFINAVTTGTLYSPVLHTKINNQNLSYTGM